MRGTEPAPVRVMMLPNSSRGGGNPFVGLLVGSLPPHVSTVPFTWKTAFTGRYDVFHAHWPEYLLQADSPVSRAGRACAFALLRPVLAVRRKPVVMTVHNRRAHSGSGRLQDKLVQQFRRSATRRAFLNEFDRETPDFRPGDKVIFHGDYRNVIAPFRSELTNLTKESGRVLLFGGLRANKGISQLIKSFGEVADPQASLQVCGRVQDGDYLGLLETLVSEDPRVNLEAREFSDHELAARIRRAQLIALPYPDLYNSGALFMALTLGRPVLVPDSPTARELRNEFGSASIHIFEGTLNGETIEAALRVTGSETEDLPRTLGGAREWPEIGRTYTDLYEQALRRRSKTQVS